jgi:hypothetical protein
VQTGRNTKGHDTRLPAWTSLRPAAEWRSW